MCSPANKSEIRSGTKCIQQSKLSARPKFRISHSEFRIKPSSKFHIHLLRRSRDATDSTRIRCLCHRKLPDPRVMTRRCRSVSVISSFPKARFLPRGGYHSISVMDFGEGLYSSRIILPLFISMIWSAMGAIALLWVMSTTVIFSRRQVSCKSPKICLPVL